MQIPFKAGQSIVLTNSDSKENTTYLIEGICGYGASCIVYDAIKEDKRKVRIKEYFPVLPSCVRNEKLVVVPEENMEGFDNGLKRFCKSYDLQQELRRDARLTNSIIPAEAYCHGYGTEYIITTDMTGEGFDKRPAESLEELLKILLSLTKILGVYHEKGILHLDIKPANIFRIPETDEHVMLFDFDSLVKMTELEQGEGLLLCSPKWAAPEQKYETRKFLCPATDYYAIGAIVFDYLFHRDITSSDRGRFCELNFDEADQRIVENLNPAIFEKLTEFFHKTLAANIKRRFSSSKELEAFIEALLKLADPRRKYILSHIPNPNSCFVGRETELEEIHERLHSSPVLCLYGIDGIGKSELMKQYAMKYKQEYESIIFAPYIDKVECVFCDDEIFHIYHFGRRVKEDFCAYYKRKMRKFKSLIDAGDKDTLIIIDNLTDFEDAGLVELLSIGCKVVVTSQVNGSVYGLNALKLDGITDISNIRKIFDSYYRKSISEEEWKDIDKIIELVNRHTLVVELLAKQMKASRICPDIMLERCRHRFSDIGREKITLNKNNEIRNNSAYELIKSIFDVSNVTDHELYILKNLSFFSSSGIHTKCFARWCGLETFDDVNELTEKGWINCDYEADCIALHPVISAVVRSSAGPDTTWMEPLLINSLKEYEGSDGLSGEAFRNVCYITKQLIDGNYNSVNIAYYLKEASSVLLVAGSLVSYKKALEKALDIYGEEFGEKNKAVSDIYCKLGNLLITTNPEEAEIYLQKARVICEELKSDENMAEILKSLGDVHLFLLSNKASHFYGRAIDYCHDQEVLSEIYAHMGDYYKSICNFRKARKCYDRAWKHLETCDYNAYSLLNLMLKYCKLPFRKLTKKIFTNVEQILKNLMDSAEKIQRDGNSIPLMMCCNMACEFYSLDKKTFELAEEYAMKCHDLLLQREDDEDAEEDMGMLPYIRYRMGMLYNEQGKLEEAEAMISQALPYFENNDIMLWSGYWYLGMINCDFGMNNDDKEKFNLSKEYFSKALDCVKANRQMAFINKLIFVGLAKIGLLLSKGLGWILKKTDLN